VSSLIGLPPQTSRRLRPTQAKISRWAAGGLLGVSSALLGQPARAASDRPADGRAACVQQHLQAQQARANGDLLGAKALLVACADDACPVPVRKECAGWLEEVQASIPSIVVIARTDDEASGPTDLRVNVDGAVVRAPTRPIEVNPGRHVVQVEATGYRPAQAIFIASVTERLKRVVVHLDALKEEADKPPTLSEPLPSTALSDAAIVGLATISVAGFAGLAWFGTSARQAERDLDKCSPFCTKKQVDKVRNKYVWANVSLGVGVAAAATALGLVIWRVPSSSSDGARADTAIEVAVGPAALRFVSRF